MAGKTKSNGTSLRYVHSDGGRKAAGFKGHTGDCLARAIAILMQRRYAQVYEELNVVCKGAHSGYGRCYSHNGISFGIYLAYMRWHGWRYHHFDTKRRRPRFFCQEDLPSGPLLVRLAVDDKHHVVAVKNHTAYDTTDVTRNHRRILGYFTKKCKRRPKSA